MFDLSVNGSVILPTLGNANLLQYMACSLFDSNASQSFVFNVCANVQYTDRVVPWKVVVTIPEGNTFSYSRVVKNCPVEVEGHNLRAYFVIFHLMRLNMILCMDWLLRHYAMIDCC